MTMGEVGKAILKAERDYISAYMDTTNMTDEEVDELFDIVRDYDYATKRG